MGLGDGIALGLLPAEGHSDSIDESGVEDMSDPYDTVDWFFPVAVTGAVEKISLCALLVKCTKYKTIQYAARCSKQRTI